MNTKPLATAITLLSGAGGSGRTSTALGLAAGLAASGNRTLFFDLNLGWGGLNITDDPRITFDNLISGDAVDTMAHATEFGFDLITCEPPVVLNPGQDEMARITYLLHELGSLYDNIVLDPPSSAHPLSLVAAGVCESIHLMVRPDAAAVASSYCLLKTLCSAGVSDRIRITFAFVDSREEAESLKSRFDQLTRRFLGRGFMDGGFFYRENSFTDGVFRPDGDFEIYNADAKNLILDDSILLRNATSGQIETLEVKI